MSAPASRPLLVLIALLATAALAGCGKSAPVSSTSSSAPIAVVGVQGAGGLSTKNTTRLGGPDPATDAAAVARAVYPGLTATTRPQAVVLVDEHNWPAALAASALASAPLGAPLLYSEGSSLPAVSSQTLAAMHPTGAAQAAGAQVIRIGATTAAAPAGYRTTTLTGSAPPALAAAVARLVSRARGVKPQQAIVLAENAPPALVMPAAGLSAESGAPILLVSTTAIPAATGTELSALHQPTIYVIGPSVLSSRVLARLAHFGPVKRIGGGPGEARAGGNPIDNAIAVARFADGTFGWGIHEPGHGLVFASSTRPLDAPASASLSANGDFGPLLLLDGLTSAAGGTSVPPALVSYLSDIKPAYSPQVPAVRSVYNHGWLIGDEQAISAITQAEIDTLLETSPRANATEEPSLPLAE
jgi:hypothetical protein